MVADLDSAEPNLDQAIWSSREHINTAGVLSNLVSRSALPGNDGKRLGRILVPKVLVLLVNLKSGEAAAR